MNKLNNNLESDQKEYGVFKGEDLSNEKNIFPDYSFFDQNEKKRINEDLMFQYQQFNLENNPINYQIDCTIAIYNYLFSYIGLGENEPI